MTAWSVWRCEAMTIVAGAWLIQGLLHIAYHIGRLGGLETIDQVGLVGSLLSIPVLAALSLWAGRGTPLARGQ